MIKSDIKPISRGMRLRIRQFEEDYMSEHGRNITKYYSYLSELANGDLALYTVAVKYHPVTRQLMMKQVVVKDRYNTFVNDLDFYYMCGYITDWTNELIDKKIHTKWYDCSNIGAWKPTSFIINKEDLQFSKYKYSGYEYYNGDDLFGYLLLWEQHKGVELLVKNGLSMLVNSKKIIKRCENDKKFCKYLLKKKDYLTTNCPYINAITKAYDTGYSIDDVDMYMSITRRYKNIKEVLRVDELRRFMLYISEHCENNYAAYNDYIEACLYLNIDMNDTKNKYPHDFRRWHDMRIDQYDMQTKKDKLVKFSKVADKYAPLQENGEFCVIIAKSKEDLVNEGEELHHCVGKMNYDKKMVDEQSLIFFVRNPEEVDTPFVTVEYSLKYKKVLQCYADHDSKPEQEVLDFVYNDWEKYATKQLRKIKKVA